MAELILRRADGTEVVIEANLPETIGRGNLEVNVKETGRDFIQKKSYIYWEIVKQGHLPLKESVEEIWNSKMNMEDIGENQSVVSYAVEKNIAGIICNEDRVVNKHLEKYGYMRSGENIKKVVDATVSQLNKYEKTTSAEYLLPTMIVNVRKELKREPLLAKTVSVAQNTGQPFEVERQWAISFTPSSKAKDKNGNPVIFVDMKAKAYAEAVRRCFIANPNGFLTDDIAYFESVEAFAAESFRNRYPSDPTKPNYSLICYISADEETGAAALYFRKERDPSLPALEIPLGKEERETVQMLYQMLYEKNKTKSTSRDERD